MHSFTDIVDGIKFTIYFFGSFSGHFHPYTPIHPLEFNETHRGIEEYGSTVNYQGWYSDTEDGPRLDRFYKFALLAKPMQPDFIIASRPGVYYHRLEKTNEQWIAKENITPETVLKQKHYLRYIINSEGKLESSFHIYSTLMYRYIYTYNERGALSNVDKAAYETPEEIPDL